MKRFIMKKKVFIFSRAMEIGGAERALLFFRKTEMLCTGSKKVLY